MANFAIDDHGFQGRLFPLQRAKLRQHFCINPWPDNSLLYQIAAEIGAPVLVVANYYNFVRNSQSSDNFLSQTYQTEQQYVGLSAETIQRLDQYLLLDPNPSFQAVTNIARELSIPRRMVEQYFDEKGSKEDELDNMLDEMLESPSKIINPGAYLGDIVERNSSQDELMRALSEVGLSTGQMNKFCSERSQWSGNPVEYPLRTGLQSVQNPGSSSQLAFGDWPSNQQFQASQDNRENSVSLIDHRGFDTAEVSYGARMSSGILTSYYGQNQVIQQNPILVHPSNQQVLTNILSQNHLTDVTSVKQDGQDHCAKLERLGTHGQLSNSQAQSPLFSEYEVMKDVEQLPQHLFHQYMQPGGNDSSLDISNIKSELHFEASDSEHPLPKKKPSPGKLITNRIENDLNIKREAVSETALSPVSFESNKADSDVCASFDQVSSFFGSSHPVSTPLKSKYVKKKKSSVKTPQGLLSPKTSMSRKRNSRCKVCVPCLAIDCGQCVYCLDKPKFGGPNKKKNACLHRRCMSMVKLSPNKSSGSNNNATPKKNIISEEFLSEALDDIPFEIEGYPNPKPLLSERSKGLIKVISNTPMKRQILVDDLSVKKIRLGIPVWEEQQAGKEFTAKLKHSQESAISKNHLLISKVGEVKSFDDQDLLKTRLLALRFDHCYSHRVEYFEGLDKETEVEHGSEIKETGLGSMLGDLMDINKVEGDSIRLNDEVKPDFIKQVVESCSEIEDNLREESRCKDENNEELGLAEADEFCTHEKISSQTWLDVNIEDKEIKDNHEQTDDKIGSDKEDSQFEDNVPIDESSFDAFLNKKMAEFEKDSFSENVRSLDDESDNNHQDANQETLEDSSGVYINKNQENIDFSDTEELLAEEYDELDSLEKKEIEEHLSEGFLGDIDDESISDVSEAKTNSILSFRFESHEKPNLSRSIKTEGTFFSPEDLKPQGCFSPENVQAQFSFHSKEVGSDKLGSDGDTNSSPENSPSPGETKLHGVNIIADFVRKSEYFQTRPSVLKVWNPQDRDQTLERDENLPAGWRMKVYTRKSGRMDIHYISPENMGMNTKYAVTEYMRMSGNYAMEEVERVAEYLRVRNEAI